MATKLKISWIITFIITISRVLFTKMMGLDPITTVYAATVLTKDVALFASVISLFFITVVIYQCSMVGHQIKNEKVGFISAIVFLICLMISLALVVSRPFSETLGITAIFISGIGNSLGTYLLVLFIINLLSHIKKTS